MGKKEKTTGNQVVLSTYSNSNGRRYNPRIPDDYQPIPSPLQLKEDTYFIDHTLGVPRVVSPFTMYQRYSVKPGEQTRLTGEENPYLNQFEVNRLLAANQSVAEKIGWGIAGGVSNFFYGFLSGVGGTFDFGLVKDVISETEQVYDNAFYRLAEPFKELGEKAMQNVYTDYDRSKPALSKAGWWSDLINQSGITFGMLGQAALETALIETLTGGLASAAQAANVSGKITRLSKILAALDKARETSNVYKKGRLAFTFALNRHGESVMEAKDSYDTVYQQLIQSGYSEDVAKALASSAASKTYKQNMALLGLDLVSVLALRFPVGKFAKPVNVIEETAKRALGRGGYVAANMGVMFGSEGFEEYVQNVIQDTSQYVAMMDAGIPTPAKDQLKSAENWNAFLLGAFTGIGLGGATELMTYVAEKRTDKFFQKMYDDTFAKMNDRRISLIKDITDEMNKPEPNLNKIRQKQRTLNTQNAALALHNDFLYGKENDEEGSFFNNYRTYINEAYKTLQEAKQTGNYEKASEFGANENNIDDLLSLYGELNTDIEIIKQEFDKHKDNVDEYSLEAVTLLSSAIRISEKELSNWLTGTKTYTASLIENVRDEQAKQILANIDAITDEIAKKNYELNTTEDEQRKEEIKEELKKLKQQIDEQISELNKIKFNSTEVETIQEWLDSITAMKYTVADISESLASMQQEYNMWMSKEHQIKQRYMMKQAEEKVREATKEANEKNKDKLKKKGIVKADENRKGEPDKVDIDAESEDMITQAEEEFKARQGVQTPPKVGVTGKDLEQAVKKGMSADSKEKIKEAAEKIERFADQEPELKSSVEEKQKESIVDENAEIVEEEEGGAIKYAPKLIKNTVDEVKLKKYVSDLINRVRDTLGIEPTFEDIANAVFEAVGKEKFDKVYNLIVKGYTLLTGEAVNSKKIYEKVTNPVKVVVEEMVSDFEQAIENEKEGFIEETEEADIPDEKVETEETENAEVNEEIEPELSEAGVVVEDTTSDNKKKEKVKIKKTELFDKYNKRTGKNFNSRILSKLLDKKLDRLNQVISEAVEGKTEKTTDEIFDQYIERDLLLQNLTDEQKTVIKAAIESTLKTGQKIDFKALFSKSGGDVVVSTKQEVKQGKLPLKIEKTEREASDENLEHLSKQKPFTVIKKSGKNKGQYTIVYDNEYTFAAFDPELGVYYYTQGETDPIISFRVVDDNGNLITDNEYGKQSWRLISPNLNNPGDNLYLAVPQDYNSRVVKYYRYVKTSDGKTVLEVHVGRYEYIKSRFGDEIERLYGSLDAIIPIVVYDSQGNEVGKINNVSWYFGASYASKYKVYRMHIENPQVRQQAAQKILKLRQAVIRTSIEQSKPYSVKITARRPGKIIYKKGNNILSKVTDKPVFAKVGRVTDEQSGNIGYEIKLSNGINILTDDINKSVYENDKVKIKFKGSGINVYSTYDVRYIGKDENGKDVYMAFVAHNTNFTNVTEHIDRIADNILTAFAIYSSKYVPDRRERERVKDDIERFSEVIGEDIDLHSQFGLVTFLKRYIDISYINIKEEPGIDMSSEIKEEIRRQAVLLQNRALDYKKRYKNDVKLGKAFIVNGYEVYFIGVDTSKQDGETVSSDGILPITNIKKVDVYTSELFNSKEARDKALEIIDWFLKHATVNVSHTTMEGKDVTIKFDDNNRSLIIKDVDDISKLYESSIETNVAAVKLPDGTYATVVHPVIKIKPDQQSQQFKDINSTEKKEDINDDTDTEINYDDPSEEPELKQETQATEEDEVAKKIISKLDRLFEDDADDEFNSIYGDRNSDRHHAPYFITPADTRKMISKAYNIEGLSPKAVADIKNFVFGTILSALTEDELNKVDFDQITKFILSKIEEVLKQRLNTTEETLSEILSEFEQNKDVLSDRYKTIIADRINKLQSYVDILKKIIDNKEVIFADVLTDLLYKYNIDLKKERDVEELEGDYYDFSQETDNNENNDTTADRNFYKTSLEENPKRTMPYKMKRFFSSIYEVVYDKETGNYRKKKGFLGLPQYVPFDKVYDTIIAILSSDELPVLDFNYMIGKLKAHQDKYPWMKQVIYKLEHSEQSVKNMFVNVMGKRFVKMLTSKYERRSDGFVYRVFDTNSAQVKYQIVSIWVNNFMLSGMYKFQEGQYVADTDAVNSLIETFEDNFLPVDQFDVKILPEKNKNLTLNQLKTYTQLEVSGALETIVNKGRAIITGKDSDGNTRKYIVKRKFKDGNILFDIDSYEGTNYSILSRWLEQLGITLSEETLKHLDTNGIMIRINRYSIKRITLQDLLRPGGKYAVFYKLFTHLISIRSNPVTSEIVTPVKVLGDVAFKLASVEAQFSKFIPSTSMVDGNKNIYLPQNSNMLGDRISELRRDPKLIEELKVADFSKFSMILDISKENVEVLNQIEIYETALNALGEIGTKTMKETNIFNLSAAELTLLKLILFQSSDTPQTAVKYYGFDTRIARFAFPTISDKERMPILQMPAIKITKDDIDLSRGLNLSDRLKKAIYMTVIAPEINRIVQAYKTNKYDGYDGFKDAAKLFILFPELNTAQVAGVNIHKFIKIKVNQGATAEQIISDIMKSSGMWQTVRNFIEKSVDEMYEAFREYGLFKDNYSMIDKNYAKDSRFEGISDKDYRDKLMLYDFFINNMFAISEMFKLFIGDPAAFAKLTDSVEEKVNTSAIETISQQEVNEFMLKTIDNMVKRFAMLMAPGDRIAGSDTSNFMQVYAEDVMTVADGIEFIISLHYGKKAVEDTDVKTLLDQAKKGDQKAVKELKKIFPAVASFFNVTATDAQEFITVQEYLDIMHKTGKLDDETYRSMKDKNKKRKEFEKKHPDKAIPEDLLFTKEEIEKIHYKSFQPLKQVYTIHMVKDGINRPVYLKYANIPLLPWETAGKEIDKLRRAMEQLEDESSMNVRLTFKSAAKIGAKVNKLKIYEGGKMVDLNTNDLFAASEVLPRKGLRTQQENPYKAGKIKEYDKVPLGTQLEKLVYGGIIPEGKIILPEEVTLKKKITNVIIPNPSNLVDINERYNNIESGKGFKVDAIEHYDPNYVKKSLGMLFVFGDNLMREGKGGQAVIRDLDNAVGIATKKKPSTSEDAYFTDDEYSENKKVIDQDIEKIKMKLASGEYDILIFPKSGIGTGLAKLKEKAPRTYQYLVQRLKEEFGFDNETGQITKINKEEVKKQRNRFELLRIYAIQNDAIYALRRGEKTNKMSIDIEVDFGNPFRSVVDEIGRPRYTDKKAGDFDEKTGTYLVSSIEEAVESYRRWLTDDEFAAQYPDLEERRQKILQAINSGKLKGKKIVYYKQLNQPSHADVLDQLINGVRYEEKKTKEISISEILDVYTTDFMRLTNTNKSVLELEFGIYGDYIDLETFREKFVQLLTEEAKKRGYNASDIKNLDARIVRNDDGTYKLQFNAPLWLLPAARKFEALLVSIARRQMIKHKFPGYAFQIMSGTLFRLTEDEDVLDRIIYTNKWKGDKLHGPTENNLAQVFVPPRFRDKDGNLIDLYQKDKDGNYVYIEEKDGRLYLKEGMIDDRLLELLSFRIPTSGLVSVASVEIAGFLPPELGDRMIIADEMIPQKGIDFDGDKEFTYWYRIDVDEQGKITKAVVNTTEYENRFKEIKAQIRQKAKMINDIIYAIETLEKQLENGEKYDGIESDLAKLRNEKRKILSELSRLKRRASDVFKQLEKGYQNKIIGIYHAIMQSEDPNIRKLIYKALEFDTEKKTAKLIEKLQSGGIKTSPIDQMTYTDKLLAGSNGKASIGVYSIALTFFSMLDEKYPLMIRGDKEKKRPVKQFSIDFGIDAQGRHIIASEFPMTRTVDGERLVQEAFESAQNTAVDEAKEGVLQRTNINKYTINVHVLLLMLGIDRATVTVGGRRVTVHLPYLLTGQRLVKEFVRRYYNKLALYNFKRSNAEYEVLKEMYEEIFNEKAKGFESIDDFYKKFVLEDELWRDGRMKFDAQTLMQTINRRDKKAFEYLIKFIFLRNTYARQLSSVIIPMSPNSSFKSDYMYIYEIRNKMIDDNKDTVDKYTLIGGIKNVYTKEGDRYYEDPVDDIDDYDQLWYTTPSGIRLKASNIVSNQILRAIEFIERYWSNHMMSGQSIIRMMFNNILKYSSLSGQNASMVSKSIERELKKYIYTYLVSEVLTDNVREKRKRLFFDYKDNMSLASYINKLVNEKNRKIINNPIINRLTFDININGEPSIIKLQSAVSGTTNSEELYYAFIDMLTDESELPDYNYDGSELIEITPDTDIINTISSGRKFVIGRKNYGLNEKEAGKFKIGEKSYKIANLGTMTYEQAVENGYIGDRFEGKMTVYKIEPFYTVKDLATDLITYTLLSEPNSMMLSLSEYIPVEFLDTVGITEKMRRLDNPVEQKKLFMSNEQIIGYVKGLTSYKFTIPSFVIQYFQHNPTQSRYVSPRNMTKVERENFRALHDGKFDDIVLFSHHYNRDGNISLYMWTQGGWMPLETVGTFMYNDYDYTSIFAEDTRQYVYGEVVKSKEYKQTIVESLQSVKTPDKLARILLDYAKENGFEHVREYELLSFLYDKFKKAGGKINVRFEKSSNFSGYYDSRTNTIVLSTDLINSPDRLMSIVTHELLHRITNDAIHNIYSYDNNGFIIIDDTLPQYAKDLAEVFNVARAKMINKYKGSIASFNAKMKKGYLVFTREERMLYYVTDIDEFIAGIMTDDWFIEELNNIKYQGKKTLLQRLLEVLEKIFKAIGIKSGSLLQYAVNYAVNFVDKSSTFSSATYIGEMNGVQVYSSNRLKDSKGQLVPYIVNKFNGRIEMYVDYDVILSWYNSLEYVDYTYGKVQERIYINEFEDASQFADFIIRFIAYKSNVDLNKVKALYGDTSDYTVLKYLLSAAKNQSLDGQIVAEFKRSKPVISVKSEGKAVLTSTPAINKVIEVETSYPASEKEFVNHSGGAIGSDSMWQEIGEKYGFTKHRHYFYRFKTPKGNVEITDSEYNEGLRYARAAAVRLGKNPATNERTKSLLARNWFQVKNSDAVFAIAKINGDIVEGGTGYAVEMAKMVGKPVYVFDDGQTNRWYKWNYDTGKFEPTDTPVLTKNFAGIGTRKITEVGKRAIADVYAKTLKLLNGEIEAEKPKVYNMFNINKSFYYESPDKISNKDGFAKALGYNSWQDLIKSDDPLIKAFVSGKTGVYLSFISTNDTGKIHYSPADGEAIMSAYEYAKKFGYYNNMYYSYLLDNIGADKLKQIAVEIRDYEYIDDDGLPVYGKYMFKSKTIVMYSSHDRSTFIHELMHALTHEAIEYSDRFNKYFNKVKERYESKYFEYYGFENAEEFISELFSNPDFQSILASEDPIEDNVIYANIWEELLNLLSNLIFKGDTDNLLFEAMDRAFEVINMFNQDLGYFTAADIKEGETTNFKC